LFEKVLDIREAVSWIAFGNFAGLGQGPRVLLEFSKYGESLERSSFGEAGRLMAFDLLWHRAELGEIRLFGRQASAVWGNLGDEKEGWGERADVPEPITSETLASASWTDDDGGGLEADAVSYWGVTVHYDDLMKCFPLEATSASETAADAATGEPRHGARSVVSVETSCRQWIADLAAQDVVPRSRDDLFSQAIAKFPNGLSRRGFDRCWDNAAPESWKRAGRKPRQN
jgi:hypothetical protein